MFSSFWNSTCFASFNVAFLFKFFISSSKSVFFPSKSSISFLLFKFVCFNLTSNFSDFKSLNSWVVMYRSWLWWSIFFSISSIFVPFKFLLSAILISSTSRYRYCLTNSSYSVFLTAWFTWFWNWFTWFLVIRRVLVFEYYFELKLNNRY